RALSRGRLPSYALALFFARTAGFSQQTTQILKSALGHKRTFSTQLRCPLYPRKRTFRDSLDQLVGALLEVKRYVESERPGRLQFEDRRDCGRRQAGQVGGLSAIEDWTGMGAALTIHAHTIGIVAHQPAGFDSLAGGIARRNPIARREGRKLDPPARE